MNQMLEFNGKELTCVNFIITKNFKIAILVKNLYNWCSGAITALALFIILVNMLLNLSFRSDKLGVGSATTLVL